MSKQWGDGVPDSAVVMLAQQILRRARLSMPCTTREQALRVIKGVKPAPAKSAPLKLSERPKGDPCLKCGQPIPTGTICRCYGTNWAEHVICPTKKKLFADCVHYVDNVINNPNAEK
jgi:hypothetical protein